MIKSQLSDKTLERNLRILNYGRPFRGNVKSENVDFAVLLICSTVSISYKVYNYSSEIIGDLLILL